MQFFYQDESERWFNYILENHEQEARMRVFALIDQGEVAETGCIETDTKDARKVRFRGKQMHAYRFIFCVRNEFAASYDDVVRHRCNNRRCINPEHLEIGTRGENFMDEREFAANGVDYSLL